jgi:hypothetical protein
MSPRTPSGKPVQPIVGEELSPPIKIEVSATFFSDGETNPKSVCEQRYPQISPP